MKNKKDRITGQTKLGEIVTYFPKAAELLADKYHLFCVGCASAAFETLEQGAQMHGFSGEEISDMVEDLNKEISDQGKTGQKKLH